MARADRTPPQEASPPAAQAELPPPPTEQAATPAEPPPPTEPPPAPAPQFQKIEEQFEKAADQLSARIQEREEQLGTAVDQLSARVQDKIGTAESQVDERLNTLHWSFTRLWVRPLCVSLAICLGVLLVAWGVAEVVAYRIGSQRETLAELKSDIEDQQATLRELEQDTWGVGYRELENGPLSGAAGGQPDRNWDGRTGQASRETPGQVRAWPSPPFPPCQPGRRGQPESRALAALPSAGECRRTSQGLDWLPHGTDGRGLPGSRCLPPRSPLVRAGPWRRVRGAALRSKLNNLRPFGRFTRDLFSRASHVQRRKSLIFLHLGLGRSACYV